MMLGTTPPVAEQNIFTYEFDAANDTLLLRNFYVVFLNGGEVVTFN